MSLSKRIKSELYGDEDNNSQDETECRLPSPPPPPRRYRSRERSIEPSIQPIELNVETLNNESRKVLGDKPYNHELYYKKLSSDESAKYDSSPYEKYPGYIQDAAKILFKSHSLVLSSDNYEDKDIVNSIIIDYSILKRIPIYFVVRNELLAHEKYFNISKNFPNISMLNLRKGKPNNTIKNGLIYVVPINVIRLLLYSGADRFNNSVIVFDDCDYMGEKDIGVLYEETLIMLEHSQLVLNFNKITNADQIGRWLCTIFNRPVESITVDYFNKPIKHFVCYVYNGRSRRMGLVYDEKKQFHEEPLIYKEPERLNTNGKDDKKSLIKEAAEYEDIYVKLVKTSKSLNQLPILVYCHNTEDVEDIASRLTDYNFNIDDKKPSKIKQKKTEMFENDQTKVVRCIKGFLETLHEDDKTNPLVETYTAYAIQGISTYHKGMMPLLRELTTELMKRNLIKVLFADELLFLETSSKFRSAIISDIKKPIDIGHTRYMKNEEYLQIVRCLKYDKENVNDNPFIVFVSEEELKADMIKDIVIPKATKIESNYKFTISCILNLSRNISTNFHDVIIDKEYILKNIFAYYQRSEMSINIEGDVRNKQALFDSIQVPEFEELERYDMLINSLNIDECYHDLMKIDKVRDWLQIGRVIRAKYNGKDFGYGIILQKPGIKTVICAFRCTLESYECGNKKYLRPKTEDEPTTMSPMKIKICDITRISKYRLRLPLEINFREIKDWLLWCFESEEKIAVGFTDLDPIDDMQIKNEDFVKRWKIYKKTLKDAEKLKNSIDDFDEKWEKYINRKKFGEELQKLKDIRDSPRMDDLNEQYDNIKSFLLPLDIFDENDKLTMKGLFAANLQTQHSVLIADILFNNKLLEDSFDAETVLKLLSYLIEIDVQDKAIRKPNFEMFDSLKAIVTKYASFWQKNTCESGRNIEQNFHYTLITIVDTLCRRYVKFEDLYKSINSQIDEGYIVSYMKNYDNLLSEILINKDYLLSIYDETFWKDFKRIRDTRIRKGIATFSVYHGLVNISRTKIEYVTE